MRLQSHIYEEGLPNILGNAQIFSHVFEEAISHIYICTVYDFATAPVCNSQLEAVQAPILRLFDL